ncbi:hypothetical protein Tco_1569627 [Tanacetum coccineum]
MEILPVLTSNSTAVGDLCDPKLIKLVTTGYRFGPVYELTTQSEDLWLDNQLLSSRFPRLYALENIKNVAIADPWNDVARFWQWRREVRGGVEQTQLDALSALLDTVTLSSERDRWWWSLDPNGILSIKVTRQWIDNVVLPNAQLSTRWNKLVPQKINILI